MEGARTPLSPARAKVGAPTQNGRAAAAGQGERRTSPVDSSAAMGEPRNSPHCSSQSGLPPPSPPFRASRSGAPGTPILEAFPSLVGARPVDLVPPMMLAESRQRCDFHNPAVSASDKIADVVAAATKIGKPDRPERPVLRFADWFADEIAARPHDAHPEKVPRSNLLEVVQAPWRVEKILGFGFLLCLDILLHELSFTPAQVLRAVPSILRGRRLNITVQCDVLRLALILANVWLVSVVFDASFVYHYIRGESPLKLYVIFNMLEMFERWLRSTGVDLFDLVMASVQDPWRSLLSKAGLSLAISFVHSTMHLLRVLLFSVAINTSSSAVFLIIVTNNFGEIKSTVFKRYDAKGLFPIITSDIVERFYLVLDILFVLVRYSIAAHRGMCSLADVVGSLTFIVVLELVTDWLKFGLIIKFSELKAATLETYKEVLMADILLCRAKRIPGVTVQGDAKKAPGAALRGIHSFSHVPSRRVGFCGVPLTTLVVVHVHMLINAPCSAYVAYPRASAALLLASFFALCLLAKVLLGVILFGCAARRRKGIGEGMELYSKIKAL